MRVASLPLVALAVLALAGCGTPPRPGAAEDGSRRTVACSASDWADCYDKAAAACGGKGYVIRGHGTDAASAGATGARAQRTVVVECREWSPR